LALREQTVRIHSEKAYQELKTFVRDEKGQAHGSPHDDRVIALAIMNQMRKHATAPDNFEKKSDYWTLDWFARLADEQRVSAEDFIGRFNTVGRAGWN